MEKCWKVIDHEISSMTNVKEFRYVIKWQKNSMSSIKAKWQPPEILISWHQSKGT